MVYWNNIAYKEDSIPKGTLKVEVYDKYNTNTIIAVSKPVYTQIVKSLDNIFPPTPKTTETALNYGQQTINVRLDNPINYPGATYPGTTNPLPVNRYEWKVPSGWSVISGTKTDSGTYITTYSAVDITTDYGGTGGVEVRGVNNCSGSDDYTVYSFPVNFTRKGLGVLEYPKTIIAGQANTYTVTVTPIAGATYEWQAPEGWSINDGGNTYTGTDNIISIRNGICMTTQKIKVRYKGSSQLFSEWAEVPSTMVAPVINMPSELKQYHSAIFSLNLPDENVSSVTWKINGVNAANVVNTSTAQFAINQKGSVSISAELSLKGCTEMITIPAIDVNVEETVFSISGPSSICSQATYTIDNLPEGATVQWSVNIPYVTLQPGQDSVIVQKTGSGFINLTASIFINGTLITTIVKEDILVGGVAGLGLSSYSNLQMLDDGSYYKILPSSGAWSYRGSLTVVASGSNLNYSWSETYASSNFIQWSANGATVDVYSKYDNLNLTLKCTASNSCGSMNRYYSFTTRTNPILPESIILSPNPASDYVDVTVFNEEEGQTEKTTSAVSFKSSPHYQIQLWNSSGLIKTIQTDQPRYQLDLTGVPPGFYYVHVIKDGQTYRRQLVVQ